jgi:hypothetical protein
MTGDGKKQAFTALQGGKNTRNTDKVPAENVCDNTFGFG